MRQRLSNNTQVNFLTLYTFVIASLEQLKPLFISPTRNQIKSVKLKIFQFLTLKVSVDILAIFPEFCTYINIISVEI